jgi:hypothetical protein
MMKTTTTISIDAELLDRARQVAQQERRSFSAQMEAWIEEALEAAQQAAGSEIGDQAGLN